MFLRMPLCFVCFLYFVSKSHKCVQDSDVKATAKTAIPKTKNIGSIASIVVLHLYFYSRNGYLVECHCVFLILFHIFSNNI
jgi:hypothetical protein